MTITATTPCMVKPGRNSRLMAEVPAEVDHGQVRILACSASISRGVVSRLPSLTKRISYGILIPSMSRLSRRWSSSIFALHCKAGQPR